MAHPFRRRRGSSMVEFALIWVAFLLMILGLIEGALAVWSYNTLAHSVRQGARYASVHGSANPVSSILIENVVRNNAVGLDNSALTVGTTWSPNSDRGSVVEVLATYQHRTALGRLIFPSGGFTLRNTSRMTVY